MRADPDKQSSYVLEQQTSQIAYYRQRSFFRLGKFTVATKMHLCRRGKCGRVVKCVASIYNTTHAHSNDHYIMVQSVAKQQKKYTSPNYKNDERREVVSHG